MPRRHGYGGRFAVALGIWIVSGATPSTTAWAEGTAQLGANQDLVEETVISVDVVSAGEVINIAVGNDSATDPSPIEVDVRGPAGEPVPGSPFIVGPGKRGWLASPDSIPTSIAMPLQIETTEAGTYTVSFDNTRLDMGPSSWMNVVDPFDITVTPSASTPIDPAHPPGGMGRIHSRRWQLNAHRFTKDASSNASFYVLTPTKPNADYTWLLQFNGLAGYQFDVRGNDIGMPAPHSSRSIEAYVSTDICPQGYTRSEDQTCAAIPPEPQFEVYLHVPALARGGSQVPQIGDFTFIGPTQFFDCAVADLPGSFSFVSDSPGTYNLVIDLDHDGRFDPGSGDVLLVGRVQVGANAVTWEGKDNSGDPLPRGDYRVKLSARIGEFHFVGKDIETANPGLRIFGVDPPLVDTAAQPTQMFWDDTWINDRTLKIQPDTTYPDGLSSGTPADPAVCSAPGETRVNAHCWGNFSGDPTLSPGDERFIDTWVFTTETTTQTEICVANELDLMGLGGGGGCETAGQIPHGRSGPGLLVILLLLPWIRARRAEARRAEARRASAQRADR